MRIGRLFGLLLLLQMGLRVNGEETISNFIRDVMASFRLTSPTIVYGIDEAPEICYTDPWVLCLSSQITESDEKELSNELDKKFIKDGRK